MFGPEKVIAAIPYKNWVYIFMESGRVWQMAIDPDTGDVKYKLLRQGFPSEINVP